MPSNLNFKPRVDGTVIPTDPQRALQLDAYSHVNTMMGVVEDEWARSMGWLFKDLKLPKSGNFLKHILWSTIDLFQNLG